MFGAGGTSDRTTLWFVDAIGSNVNAYGLIKTTTTNFSFNGTVYKGASFNGTPLKGISINDTIVYNP